MKPLHPDSLHALAGEVAIPRYDRASLQPGILHLGLGAFQRAHQAVYTENLVAAGDHRWGVVGVSLREPATARKLELQDHLYSVTERHGEAAVTRVMGVLRGALYAPECRASVLEAIASPQTHLVSITVTEKGYSLNPATADLDLEDAGILHDLQQPTAPVTTLGVLAAGIRMRPRHAPLTLVSCDNMAGNGDILRKLLVQYSAQLDAGLASRIGQDIGMPNSMVDRIVPAATAQSLEWACRRLGLRDEAAIVCEPFSQWVIEDRFTGPRPAWEDVGAVLTNDVRPYQEMKLRLLNGTHSAIAYAGQLCGLKTVSDVMADTQVGGFVRRLMLEDLRTSVNCPAGYDIDSYCQDLLRRFQNPSLGHKTEQIAMDGSQKVAVRWLPALRESLEQGKELRCLERALSLWLHYLAQPVNQAGRPLNVNDPGAGALALDVRAAATGQDRVQAALTHTKIFGNTAWPPSFIQRQARYLDLLREGAISSLLSQ